MEAVPSWHVHLTDGIRRIPPRLGSKALCVKVRQRTRPANGPGTHGKQLWSSFSYKGFVWGEMTKIWFSHPWLCLVVAGTWPENWGFSWASVLVSLVQKEQECAVSMLLTPRACHCSTASLLSLMLIPNSLMKLIIHLLSFVTLPFPKGYCFWICKVSLFVRNLARMEYFIANVLLILIISGFNFFLFFPLILNLFSFQLRTSLCCRPLPPHTCSSSHLRRWCRGKWSFPPLPHHCLSHLPMLHSLLGS